MLDTGEALGAESDFRQTRAVGRVQNAVARWRPISWRTKKGRMDSSAPRCSRYIVGTQLHRYVQGQARVVPKVPRGPGQPALRTKDEDSTETRRADGDPRRGGSAPSTNNCSKTIADDFDLHLSVEREVMAAAL